MTVEPFCVIGSYSAILPTHANPALLVMKVFTMCHRHKIVFVFCADRKVTGGPHITASPFLRESLTNADMFCINRLRLFVLGGG